MRDNCKYYLHDLFRRYPAALGEGEIIVNEPGRDCTYYLPKQEQFEVRVEEDPFAAIMQHNG